MIAAFAALLATAAAAGGGAGAAERVAAAERTLASVEATGCPADASPERTAREADAGLLSPEAAKAWDAGREDARLYFSCRAYAAGSSAPCAVVARTPARVAYSVDKAALKRPDTLEFLCASDLQDMRMARAFIARDRAAFAAACRAHDAAGHRDFAPGKTEKACALLADGGSDPKEACRRVGPLFSNPAPAGFCEGELRQFAGEEAHCLAIEGQPASRELCLGYAAWRAARGGDKAACAASPVCRVLSGAGAEACAPIGARAIAGVCAARDTPAALKSAEAALDDADHEIARAESGTGATLAEARDDDALADRVARARLRLAALRPVKEGTK